MDDVSLTVEPGRIYGFLGPNGAGKSTTMNIVTGYLGATSGEVKINGYDIFKQPEEAKRCIGYLPEIPPLYMDMSVEEYLYFAAELKDVPLKAGRKEKKKLRKQYVEEAMEMVLITDQRNRLIRNLSKGYRQRVGLAQAVLGYPEVIILDEPTVGLDPKQIIEIRRLIKKLGERHTVILSSHILSEVREVCDYIYILSEGKLVAGDTTEHLLQQVAHGKRRIEIVLEEDGAAAEEWLKETGIVQEVSLRPGTEEGTVVLSVTVPEGDEIRNKILREFVYADIPVLELKSAGKSLEEIFLALTNPGHLPQEEDLPQEEFYPEDPLFPEHDVSGEERFPIGDLLRKEETEGVDLDDSNL